MKAWERQRIEYRPSIGYQTNISRSVTSTATERQYTKADLNTLPRRLLTDRAAEYLGMDAIDNLLASLSRAHELKNKIESDLSQYEPFQDYVSMTATDDPYLHLEANKIHDSNMLLLDGRPEFDVYPMIVEAEKEMEQYLDFLNQGLFDGEVDYNDTSKTRKEEESLIESLIHQEQKGEIIDYDKLNSRVMVIATARSKVEYFKQLLDESEDYLSMSTSDQFYGDVDNALYEMAKIPNEELTKVKEILEQNFYRHANQSVNSKYNMARLSNRDVRETLDTQMIEVRDKMQEYQSSLHSFTHTDDEDPIGMQVIKNAIADGLHGMEDTMEFMVVEHLSNSAQNKRQLQQIFDGLKQKRKNQLIHQLTNQFEKEFDYNDVDKEVQRFKKSQDL